MSVWISSSVTVNPHRARCMECFVKLKWDTQAQRCFQTDILQDATTENFDTYLVWGFYSRPLKMGPKRFPKTLVRNYHYSLYNNPEYGRQFSFFCREFKETKVFCSRKVQGIHMCLMKIFSAYMAVHLSWHQLWIMYCITFQLTTPCTGPFLAGLWPLNWVANVELQYSGKQRSLPSVGYSFNLLRVSVSDDTWTVCLCLFIKILFASKIVKVWYICPVYKNQDI